MSDEDDNDASAPAGEADADTIARATEMGWVSPESWKGAPPRAGFLDPAEFVRRGEKVMPLINARARKAEEHVAKLQAELDTTRAEHRSNLDRIERMSRATLENQRSQIEAKYDAQKQYAVETGDKAAYREIVKEEKEITKAFDERVAEVEKPKKGADAAPELSKEVKDVTDAWFVNNAWFNQDPEMNALANVHHQRLIKEKSGLTLAQNLEEVSKYIRKRFPEKFSTSDDGEDDAPVRGSRVEGSARLGGGSQSQWARVPKDNRQVAEKADHIRYFLEPGETMQKNKSQAQERWAAKYFEGEQ